MDRRPPLRRGRIEPRRSIDQAAAHEALPRRPGPTLRSPTTAPSCALRQRRTGRRKRPAPTRWSPKAISKIGAATEYGDYFNGRIDEVRLYNRALSEAEVQADTRSPDPDPEADASRRVLLRRRSGTAGKDVTGDEHTATISKAPNGRPMGRYGGASNSKPPNTTPDDRRLARTRLQRRIHPRGLGTARNGN